MHYFSALLWLLALLSSSLALPVVLYDNGLNGTYPETKHHLFNYVVPGRSTVSTLFTM